jgi:hypothetical protein
MSDIGLQVVLQYQSVIAMHGREKLWKLTGTHEPVLTCLLKDSSAYVRDFLSAAYTGRTHIRPVVGEPRKSSEKIKS